VKHFEFQTLEQLGQTARSSPTEYLVEGLLPVGSVNMLAGKPKSGKSTLARQLAVAVANGAPFLGRNTQQGQVMYFGIEELACFVSEHFQKLGAKDGILTSTGNVGKQATERLDEALEAHPDTKLVIVDPLFKFAKTPDTDKYVEVSESLQGLADIAQRRKVTILCVHHSKKRETEEMGDSALGSTAIVGGMFTNIFLRGEGNGVRTIATTQRYGSIIEPTTLEFNPDRGIYELGTLVTAIEEAASTSKRDRFTESILHTVSNFPGIEYGDLLKTVGGRTSNFSKCVGELVTLGLLEVEGDGRRGNPKRYYLENSRENAQSAQSVPYDESELVAA